MSDFKATMRKIITDIRLPNHAQFCVFYFTNTKVNEPLVKHEKNRRPRRRCCIAAAVSSVLVYVV